MNHYNHIQPRPSVRVQLEVETFAQIEDWRRAQEEIPSRPAAMRELVKRGLGAAERSTAHRRSCKRESAISEVPPRREPNGA
jgi:hypothetical protein